MLNRRHDNGHQLPFSSEVTPFEIALDRRVWLQRLALGAGGAALGSWACRDVFAQPGTTLGRPGGQLAALPGMRSSLAGGNTVEKITAYKHASTYNNFYEFGTNKADPAVNANTLKVRPWTVAVEGL